MKIARHIFYILVFIFIGTQSLIGAGSNDSSGKIIKLLSKELGIDKNQVQLTSIENTNLSSVYISEAFSVKNINQNIGFAIVGEGKGRYDSFNYLIFYDEDRKIVWVRVIAYYSDHGSQIASKRWLNQFTGYAGGEMDYGDEIQAISGATLSAGSITKGIQEITTILQDCNL